MVMHEAGVVVTAVAAYRIWNSSGKYIHTHALTRSIFHRKNIQSSDGMWCVCVCARVPFFQMYLFLTSKFYVRRFHLCLSALCLCISANAKSNMLCFDGTIHNVVQHMLLLHTRKLHVHIVFTSYVALPFLWENDRIENVGLTHCAPKIIIWENEKLRNGVVEWMNMG